MVLYELANTEGITVDPGEVENEALNTLNDLMRYVPPDQFKRMSKDRKFISQLSRNASVDVMSRKTIERLNAIARGEADASPAAASEPEVSEPPASEPAVTEAAPETQPQPVMETPAEETAPVVEETVLTEVPVSENNQQEG